MNTPQDNFSTPVVASTGVHTCRWEALIQSAESQPGNTPIGAIYRVYCQKTDISYVGQTTDLWLTGKGKQRKPTRIKSHYAALRKGCHPSKKLQAHWNATNGESFTDECLEIITLPEQLKKDYYLQRQTLTDREKFWQEKHSAKTGRSLPEDRHYPLKAEELKLLKASGIINNATLVYFIIKLKNPWCDRPVKVHPLEIAAEWGIPESSVYEAILKLRDSEIIEISKNEIVVKWHSQQADHSGNPESFRESRIDSGKSESILENQNEFQESRIDSGRSENQSLEPLQPETSGTSHTIQTDQTLKTLSDIQAPTENRERDDDDLFDQEGEPIAPYKDWLIRKADKLPNPIGIIELWLEKNARKPALIKAYRQIENQSSAAPSSVDLNAVIADINAELKRLNWSEDEAIAYMVRFNGWQRAAFAQLSDRDLSGLLHVLELVEVDAEEDNEVDEEDAE